MLIARGMCSSFIRLSHLQARVFGKLNKESELHEALQAQGISYTTALSDVRHFDALRFSSSLRTSYCGRNVIFFEKVASTMSVINNLPQGTVVIAHEQSQGVGRNQNTWRSSAGSAIFTLHELFDKTNSFLSNCLSLLQMITALSVTYAVCQILNINYERSHEFMKIKWPNDVFLDGHKISGILCDSAAEGNLIQVKVGVGANILNDEASLFSLKQYASKKDHSTTSNNLSVEYFIAETLNKYEALTKGIETSEGNLKPFYQEYYRHWRHSGQSVYIDHLHRNGTIVGITKNGYLRVELDNLKEVEISCSAHHLDPSGNAVTECK